MGVDVICVVVQMFMAGHRLVAAVRPQAGVRGALIAETDDRKVGERTG